MKSPFRIIGSDLFSMSLFNKLKSKLSTIEFSCRYCYKQQSDINIVASYGIKIPQKCIQEGTWINVHPSLLPEYRGPTPIEHNLLFGNRMGISLITLADKLDCGQLYAQQEIPYVLEPYIYSIFRHSDKAADLLLEILPKLSTIKTKEQQGIISHSKKINASMATLNFHSMTSLDILKRFYAISHRYRLRTKWRSHLMFLDDIELDPMYIHPNNFIITKDCMYIGCKSGTLKINTLSRLSGVRCDPKSFFNGLRYPNSTGVFNTDEQGSKLFI